MIVIIIGIVIIIVLIIIIVLVTKNKNKKANVNVDIDVPVLKNGQILSKGKVIVVQPGVYPMSAIDTTGGQHLRKQVLNDDRIMQNVFPPGMLIPCYNYKDNRSKKGDVVTYDDGTKVVICDSNIEIDISEYKQFQQLVSSPTFKQQNLQGLVMKQEGKEKQRLQPSYNVTGMPDNVQFDPLQQYVGINVLNTGMDVTYHMVIQ